MSDVVEYVKTAALGDLKVTWLDTDGDVIDFSAGYSFELKIGHGGSAASLTKTTGIAGASTAPNVTVAWDSDDLSDIRGDYVLQITATEDASSKPRILQKPIRIKDVVT